MLPRKIPTPKQPIEFGTELDAYFAFTRAPA
jgi:hypothetical protein